MSATRQPIVHNLESPTTEVTMTSTRNASIRNRIISNPGRVAGLWYLLLVFLGPQGFLFQLLQGDTLHLAARPCFARALERLGVGARELGLELGLQVPLAKHRQ